MNAIIEELLDKGFTVELSKNDKKEVQYKVDGFYKSSNITLRITTDGILMAESRYDQLDEIYSFDDLVCLNFVWWSRCKEREGICKPDENWLPFLIQNGYIKEETTIKKEYVSVK